MSCLTRRTMLLASLSSLFLAGQARAAGCRHCGCHNGCRKVCRLVCEEKKVEITCWGSKEEEFCIPGPSRPGCKHCETVCAECDDKHDPKSPLVLPKKFVWTEWIPGCAKVHTRKKLMKRTITKTIPSYKWVVEDLCDQCTAATPSVAVAPDALIPPLPDLDPSITVMPVSVASPQ